MRDDIKVVLHILHSVINGLDMCHFGKFNLVGSYLLEHEVDIFFLSILALEADIEVRSRDEIGLEVSIGLSCLRMNL